MLVLGIDPGLNGAIVSFDGANILFCDFKTIKSPSRGREIVWVDVANNLAFFNADHIFLERVHSRPGEGVSSAFKFGMCYGGLLGAIASIQSSLTIITPQKWKKFYGLGSSKEDSVLLAENIFPEQAEIFRGPRGGLKDGRAEAALIASYGYYLTMINERIE